jgi:putative addiction module component (TIGR02574 family)
MTRAEMESLLHLPVDERAELAQLLWQSLEQEREVLLTAEDKRVIEERLAEMERDPDAGIPWEEVRAELWPGK